MRTIRLLSALAVLGGFALALTTGAAVHAQDQKKKEKKQPEKKEPEKKAEKKAEPEKKKEAEKPAGAEIKHLVSNLENPCGVAVHPKTGHVFVSSRYAIYRYDPQAKAVHIEIAGYPDDETIDKYGMGPTYPMGSLGLAFLGEDRLVAGGGELPDPEELVRIFKVGEKPLEEFIDLSAAEQTTGPIGPDPEKTAKGEGNYYGVAIIGDAIYVTCNGDDTKGWIAKAEVDEDGKVGKLMLAIATKVATEKALGTGVDAPVPAIASPDGKLVVGQMGEIDLPGDSLLTIYDPGTGELKKVYKTGLDDIAGLAYHPKTRKLYATDFSWLNHGKTPGKQGGLYELVIKGDAVEAKKIELIMQQDDAVERFDLDKPTAIAFDKDGNLYLAQFGSLPKDAPTDPNDPKYKSPGGLYVIEAGQLE